MPQIGLDCEIILDNTGYFVKPGSYIMRQPRNRKITRLAPMVPTPMSISDQASVYGS